MLRFSAVFFIYLLFFGDAAVMGWMGEDEDEEEERDPGGSIAVSALE